MLLSKVGHVQFSVFLDNWNSTSCLYIPVSLHKMASPILEQLAPCFPSNHGEALADRWLVHIFPKCAMEPTMTQCEQMCGCIASTFGFLMQTLLLVSCLAVV